MTVRAGDSELHVHGMYTCTYQKSLKAWKVWIMVHGEWSQAQPSVLHVPDMKH